MLNDFGRHLIGCPKFVFILEREEGFLSTIRIESGCFRQTLLSFGG